MSITLLMKWQMLQAIFEHPNVSASAKVIAGRLLDHFNTRTEQCNPSYETLAVGSGLSRATAVLSVSQLEAAGFIKVARSVEKGKLAQPGHRLPSNGFSFEWSKIHTTHSLKSRPPQSENLTTPVGKLDHPQSEKPTRGSQKSRPKTKKEETEKDEAGNLKLIEGTTTPHGFDEFWKQYPKRVGKTAAQKAFAKALKGGALTDAIIAGTLRYAAARTNQDPKYTKHPAAWLNDERWLDEAEPSHQPPLRTNDSMVAGLFSGLDPSEFKVSRNTAAGVGFRSPRRRDDDIDF